MICIQYLESEFFISSEKKKLFGVWVGFVLVASSKIVFGRQMKKFFNVSNTDQSRTDARVKSLAENTIAIKIIVKSHRSGYK